MAGIGFALRTLVERDDLGARVQGYGHAAVVAAGPWLFTVLALAGFSAATRGVLNHKELSQVTALIIYNFSFSLVISGPIVMVLTRHLANCLFARRAEDVPGVLIAALILLWGVQLPIGIAFLVFVLDLPTADSLLSLIGFLVTGGIWVACVFLSTLKNFRAITVSFALGMLVAFLAATFLSPIYGDTGALAGLTLGLVVIFYGLLGCILAEYPYPIKNLLSVLPSFRRYWDLALVGLFYNAAIWVDKWVMWLSPDGQSVGRGLVTNPAYDSSMFLAYLTIVPALVLFVVSVETRFYERYITFYADIQNHATLQKIKHNHKLIMTALGEGIRNITVVQGVICYLALLIAPGLIRAGEWRNRTCIDFSLRHSRSVLSHAASLRDCRARVLRYAPYPSLRYGSVFLIQCDLNCRFHSLWTRLDRLRLLPRQLAFFYCSSARQRLVDQTSAFHDLCRQ